MDTITEFELNDALTTKKFRVVYGYRDLRLTVEIVAINMYRAIDKVEKSHIGDSKGFRVLSVKEIRPQFIG